LDLAIQAERKDPSVRFALAADWQIRRITGAFAEY